MTLIESASHVRRHIKCIACELHSGEISTKGVSVMITKHFEVSPSYEHPIPGFMILSSMRHVKSFEELTLVERKELAELTYKIRCAMSKTLHITRVTLVQEEHTPNSHFHIWFFPWWPWMKKHGTTLSDIRPIMQYSKRHMRKKQHLTKVETAAAKLRKTLNSNAHL